MLLACGNSWICFAEVVTKRWMPAISQAWRVVPSLGFVGPSLDLLGGYRLAADGFGAHGIVVHKNLRSRPRGGVNRGLPGVSYRRWKKHRVPHLGQAQRVDVGHDVVGSAFRQHDPVEQLSVALVRNVEGLIAVRPVQVLWEPNLTLGLGGRPCATSAWAR